MLAQASVGTPAKGSWGSYQAWWGEGKGKQGYKRPTVALATAGAPE